MQTEENSKGYCNRICSRCSYGSMYRYNKVPVMDSEQEVRNWRIH